MYVLPFSLVVSIGTSEWSPIGYGIQSANMHISPVIAGQINSRLNIVRPVVWVGYGISALGYGLCIQYLVYEGGVGNQMGVFIVLGLGVGLSLAVPLLCVQAVSDPYSGRVVT